MSSDHAKAQLLDSQVLKVQLKPQRLSQNCPFLLFGQIFDTFSVTTCVCFKSGLIKIIKSVLEGMGAIKF